MLNSQRVWVEIKHTQHVADEHLIVQSQQQFLVKFLQVGKASRAQALVKRARKPKRPVPVLGFKKVP